MKQKSRKVRERSKHDDAWERGFAALTKFKKREGHCCVSRSHVEGSYRLGKWVHAQRFAGDRVIGTQRGQRLKEIGFVWNPREYSWQIHIEALKAYKRREGHCRVEHPHVEGIVRLGNWVDRQRRKKRQNVISAERKKKLDEVGFHWGV